MSETILQVLGLTKRFGGVAAVDNCSLEVKARFDNRVNRTQWASKTTLFNLITGSFPRTKGE